MLRRGNPSRRLNLAMLCIAFVLTLFAARLVQMQGFQSAAYQKKAATQRLKVIPIPAVRGAITASDGTVLAMTARTDLVFADPPLMPPSKRADAAAKLAGPLGLPAEQILRLINGAAPGNEYVVLAKNVPAAAGDAVAKLNLLGIGETPSYARVYPNGNLAANLIGFATSPATAATCAARPAWSTSTTRCWPARTASRRSRPARTGSRSRSPRTRSSRPCRPAACA